MKRLLTIILPCCLIAIAGCSDSSTDSQPPPPTESNIIRVPANQPTIQAGLDAANNGDTVLVADGIYTSDGNRNIDFPCKNIVLKSENGPLTTIIDCEGDSANHHFGFSFLTCDSAAVIVGFTVKNAYYNLGSAIACQSFSPIIKNCIFAKNHAIVSGGAIRCKSASPTITNCTMVKNSSAMVGGGIFLIAGSSPNLNYCIISHSTMGEAVFVSGGDCEPVFACCNIYGNAGGDWTDDIYVQAFINGNGSADPLYCNPDGGDFRLQPESPCAPANNSCNALIGAGEVGCE